MWRWSTLNLYLGDIDSGSRCRLHFGMTRYPITLRSTSPTVLIVSCREAVVGQHQMGKLLPSTALPRTTAADAQFSVLKDMMPKHPT